MASDDVDHAGFGENDTKILQNLLLAIQREVIFILADDDISGETDTKQYNYRKNHDVI